jgi:hypothetical protein
MRFNDVSQIDRRIALHQIGHEPSEIGVIAIDIFGRQEIARRAAVAVAFARIWFVVVLSAGVMVVATGFATVVGRRAGRSVDAISGEVEMAPAATQQSVSPEANCGDDGDDEAHL